MLAGAAPCLAMLFWLWCRFKDDDDDEEEDDNDDELAVQLLPRSQFSSDRKGSATRGLTSAPRPMKKCKTCCET